MNMLVFLSCQEILAMRVYALYFGKRIVIVGLVVLHITLLSVVIVLISRQAQLEADVVPSQPTQLYVFNIAGLTTDGVLFALILARAIRLQSTFRIGETANARETSFVSTLGRVSGAGRSLISLILSESIVYYSTMLLMYSVTFVAYRLKPEDAVFQNGLVSLMAVMTGIMAPKLLLDIRREYYGGEENRSSEMQTRGTITWQIAEPSRHDYSAGADPSVSAMH